MSNTELVLILHGLGNSTLRTSILSQYLRLSGFAVLNLGYPSCCHGTEKLCDYINQKLREKWNEGNYDSLSIVGFSLGSQLARLLIEQNFLNYKFSRCVMLGPPNNSSSMARFLRKYLPSKKIWGPVFDELCRHSLPNPASKIEIGIIAGGLGQRFGFNPFLRGDNDGLVTVEETLLDGAKEHRKILISHGSIPFRPRVLRMTKNFLKYGQFDDPK